MTAKRPPKPLDEDALRDLALRHVARFATSRGKLLAYLNRKLRERGWAGDLAAPPPRSATNPKSALQEWAQGRGRPLPTYRIVERTGPDHAPTFTVAVVVEGVEPLTAQGRSRQEAEKAAATALLKREGVI